MKTGVLDGSSGFPEVINRTGNTNTCPRCHGPVKRIHRRLPERLLSLFHSVRRYRCPSESCGWRGLIGPPKTSTSVWAGAASGRTVWAVVGILALLLVAALWLAYRYYERVRARAERAAAAGGHGEGVGRRINHRAAACWR